jgi:hypothetical protein
MIDCLRLALLRWRRDRGWGRPLPKWPRVLLRILDQGARLALRWRERQIDRPWSVKASGRIDRALVWLESLRG